MGYTIFAGCDAGSDIWRTAVQLSSLRSALEDEGAPATDVVCCASVNAPAGMPLVKVVKSSGRVVAGGEDGKFYSVQDMIFELDPSKAASPMAGSGAGLTFGGKKDFVVVLAGCDPWCAAVEGAALQKRIQELAGGPLPAVVTQTAGDAPVTVLSEGQQLCSGASVAEVQAMLCSGTALKRPAEAPSVSFEMNMEEPAAQEEPAAAPVAAEEPAPAATTVEEAAPCVAEEPVPAPSEAKEPAPASTTVEEAAPCVAEEPVPAPSEAKEPAPAPVAAVAAAPCVEEEPTLAPSEEKEPAPAPPAEPAPAPSAAKEPAPAPPAEPAPAPSAAKETIQTAPAVPASEPAPQPAAASGGEPPAAAGTTASQAATVASTTQPAPKKKAGCTCQ